MEGKSIRHAVRWTGLCFAFFDFGAVAGCGGMFVVEEGFPVFGISEGVVGVVGGMNVLVVGFAFLYACSV